MGITRKNAGSSGLSGSLAAFAWVEIRYTSLYSNHSSPKTRVTEVAAAAIPAIMALLEMATMPDPARLTKANAKTSSSQMKLNCVRSTPFANQVLSAFTSRKSSATQRMPKKMSDGSIQACRFLDTQGTKKPKGAQKTFAVMAKEATMANMPAF